MHSEFSVDSLIVCVCSFVNPYDKEGAKKELDRIAQEEQQRRAKEKSKDVKMTKDKKSSSKSEL